MSGLRVAFMGTPDFSVSALRALHESAHEIVCVYSQPPRPKGRGQQVQNSPVHEFAALKNIPVFTPKTLKTTQAQEEFVAHKIDIAVVVAYGLLLPKAVLDAPKFGCLNIHASLLPRWRGASPIQQSIWKGDLETGVTIMQMDEGLDTGPMILKRSVPIKSDMTATALHDRLSGLGAEMIVEVLNIAARDGALKSIPQDNAQTTYAPLLKKEDGKIDWSQSSVEIDRQVRALNPWPGVFCKLGDDRLKVLQADFASQKTDQKPGTILDRAGHVACANGFVLRLLKVQPDNAKAMDFASALNGGYVHEGDLLQ